MLLTLAAAQPSGSAPAATTTISLSPVQTCLNACTQATSTVTLPASACHTPGDGSPAASQRYAECRKACISSYIVTSTVGGAVVATGSAQASGAAAASATGSGASAAASMSAMASSAASNASRVASTASYSGTATGSATASTFSGAAASNRPLGISSAGVVGLVFGAFA